MRTTLTIEESIARALKQRAYETGLSFKAVVNETLRKGLEREKRKPERNKKFRQRTYEMGVPLLDLTKANQLAGEHEDAELIRKMELGK